MRVAVLGSGYSSATEAFVTGNLLAAGACESLCERLQGLAAMAGDDSTATEFAASYDEAAAESVQALVELVNAFGSLAHLSEASLANHHTAEVASGGCSIPGPPTRADDCVSMLAPPPPSSLGGDLSSVPGWANLVLDVLEGVVWPDADTDRLRAAATSWRTAATSVGLLSAHCETALLGFEEEVSPEIGLAVATTQDLRARVETLADQLLAIALACETYADQVDAKRAEMLDLLKGLAVELGVGALVAGILSGLSAGLAAGAGGAAAGSRLAAAARELQAIVDALRLAAGGTATTLRPVSVTLRDSRAYLSRLTAARLAARTERGSLDPGAWRSGWLGGHERAGGHVIARHVGKSDEDLLLRLETEARPNFASTFPDEASAERAITTLLSGRRSQLDEWLASGTGPLRLQDRLDFIVGRTADRGGNVFEVSGVRAILVRDPSMPDGYRILTAYPRP